MEKNERPQIQCIKDQRFYALAERCAAGDADAMYEMGRWFISWVDQENELPDLSFEEKCANFWFYRAMKMGSAAAQAWLDQREEKTPGKPLYGFYCWQPEGEINGWKLSEAGFLFFDPDTDYCLSDPDENGVVLASVYCGDSGSDSSGFGSEIEYDWYFLDENLVPIEGMRVLYGWHDLNNSSGREYLQQAAHKLRERKDH